MVTGKAWNAGKGFPPVKSRNTAWGYLPSNADATEMGTAPNAAP